MGHTSDCEVTEVTLPRRQQEWLFYSLLGVILVVSLVMVAALFRHFILDRSVTYVEWVLGAFVVEIVGCFVLGWKVVVGGSKSDTQTNPAILEKMDYAEDVRDSSVQHKNAALRFLDLGRNRNHPYFKRRKFIRRAIQILETISAGQSAYPAARYNLGTAYRELKKYDVALRYYEEAENCLDNELKHSPSEERERRKSDIIFMKGRVFDAKGEKAQARKLYEESWMMYPNDYGVVFNLYEICKETGENEEATVWYSLLRRFPQHQRVRGNDKQSVS